VSRKALKREVINKVLAGEMTVEEGQERLGRKKARREDQKAQEAARDAVRAMRQGYAMKGAYPGDLPEHLSDAELAYATVIARTNRQQAMTVKSASKQAAPAGPSRQKVANKAAADWHRASKLLSAPPVVTKQLTGVERRIAAAMEAERDSTASSSRRIYLDDQIARIKGLTPVGGV
jgi:hypothetical protein